jgi:CO/xanthine dehydrogenase FAD-binding subunit
VNGLETLARGRALDTAAIDAIAETAHRQCRPQTSVPYDTDYRHDMVPVFVKRAVREALET